MAGPYNADPDTARALVVRALHHMPDAVPPLPPPRQVLPPVMPVWLMRLLLLLLGLSWIALAICWGPMLLLGLPLLVLGAWAGALLARRQLAGAVVGMLDDAGHDLDKPLGAAPGRETGHALATMAPALRPMANGLQRLLVQHRALFGAQAEQLEALRQQAHQDGLTGLPNRRHFLATLDALMVGEGAPVQAGLLLLRLNDLQGMNQRIGHDATDHVLQAMAQALQSYPRRIERCFVGRLNGADFALLLPVGGIVAETAMALVRALRLPITRIDPQASVAAGVVELQSPITANQALALADAALAHAEHGNGFGASQFDDAMPDPRDTQAQGQASWQRGITSALQEGRVKLGEFPVRTADGRLLHLDCPLRVQLAAGGLFEPASRWLALAMRSQLCAEVDEQVLALALAATLRDGRARCVNVAAQSVASAEFVAAVSQRLEAAPSAACRLWIDLPESLALDRPQLVRELSRRWRPLGVMLGLEHAGEGLARMPQLIDLGLDCVRIDSRFVNGLSAPGAEAAVRYLHGLVRLVQSVGLQITAEGVRSAADLEVLWRLGFDAATGPALSAEDAAVD